MSAIQKYITNRLFEAEDTDVGAGTLVFEVVKYSDHLKALKELLEALDGASAFLTKKQRNLAEKVITKYRKETAA